MVNHPIRIRIERNLSPKNNLGHYGGR